MAMMRLDLDVESRRMLQGEAVFACEGDALEAAFTSRDREAVIRLRALESRMIDVLDRIGWEDVDEGVSVDVDTDLFRGWLIDLRSTYEADLGADVVTLARQERGEEDHIYSGMSQEESVAHTRERIEQDHARVERAHGLVKQMVEHRGKAVTA